MSVQNSMTLKEIIRILKKHRPTNVYEARNAGIPLRFIGAGSFRNVYRVTGAPYVIKFPHGNVDNGDLREAEEHAHTEANAIKQMYRYSAIRPLLPKIHFHDPDTGATLMEHYKKNNDPMSINIDTALGVISRLINALTKYKLSLGDVHSGNVRFTNDGLKLLDLGYIGSD